VKDRLQVVAASSLIGLIFLCLAWELWLVPLRAGGSALALKALLLLALFGILRGRRYTYQWASMLILAFFTEGVVRAWSERGSGQWLAAGELRFRSRSSPRRFSMVAPLGRDRLEDPAAAGREGRRQVPPAFDGFEGRCGRIPYPLHTGCAGFCQLRGRLVAPLPCA
jgi:uncharacterized membrane protein